jgi:heat shock protein HtpX
MSSRLRTIIPLTILTMLFLAIGYYFAGTAGIVVGILLALAFNFVSFWYSDKIVLRMYNAKKVRSSDYPELEKSIKKIAKKANIPQPPLYYINTDTPNAFATGRSPNHAAVAVTKGLLATLDTREVEAVLAHELGHVKNRDTLISTMAATIAGAITWLSYIFFFGNSENRSIFSFLLLFILAPMAALILQMTISRSREFAADKIGAMLTDPLHLASALEKIHSSVKTHPIEGNSSFSALFIVNPFRADTLARLFSTHPPVEERVSILRKMAM